MNKHLHRVATTSAKVVGAVGLATALMAGPAQALDLIPPGGGANVGTSAEAPVIVLQPKEGMQLGQPGTAAVFGGVVVAAAASAALTRRHHRHA